jgi:hypothetical protein
MRVVEGFIATTERARTYGGVRLADSLIQQIADEVRSNGVQFQAMHDARQHLDANVLDVQIRPVRDGVSGVWARLEVADNWNDDWSGFSISVKEPVFKAEDPMKPALFVSADAGHFETVDLRQLGEALRDEFSVSTARLYQFSMEVPAKVIIEIVMNALVNLPANLLGSYLWDNLKVWFLPRGKGPSVFEFHVKDRVTEIKGLVETSDPEILREAMSGLTDVVRAARSTSSFEYDKTEKRWEQFR